MIDNHLGAGGVAPHFVADGILPALKRARAQRLIFYRELGSVFKGRPRVDTNRRSGDSVDSFDAD
jgi:hypothetical protein